MARSGWAGARAASRLTSAMSTAASTSRTPPWACPTAMATTWRRCRSPSTRTGDRGLPQQLRHGRVELVEAIDQGVAAEVLGRNVGIAEGDHHHGDLRVLGGQHVVDAVAHHHRALGIAAD